MGCSRGGLQSLVRWIGMSYRAHTYGDRNLLSGIWIEEKSWGPKLENSFPIEDDFSYLDSCEGETCGYIPQLSMKKAVTRQTKLMLWKSKDSIARFSVASWNGAQSRQGAFYVLTYKSEEMSLRNAASFYPASFCCGLNSVPKYEKSSALSLYLWPWLMAAKRRFPLSTCHFTSWRFQKSWQLL